MKELFNSGVAFICTTASYLIGDWDTSLAILLIFVIFDYITGVVSAYITKTLNSHVGFSGLAKKALIIVILIVATSFDRLLNYDGWILRTAVCWFYISNEGISILENVDKAGVTIPRRLKDALEQLKAKAEEEKEDLEGVINEDK